MSEPRILVFKDSELLIRDFSSGIESLPLETEIQVKKDAFEFAFEEVGDDAGKEYSFKVCTYDAVENYPPGFHWQDLRNTLSVTPKLYKAISKGRELTAWNEETKFCQADGSVLSRNSEISKLCPVCGKEYFPVLSPAIVVLVKKGEEALLVHSRSFKRKIFALVAGFVEYGESLEQCVKREVKEETDLDIENIRYFGSQSWPFPHQLMVGFTAEYAGGEIAFKDRELDEGGFFTRDNVPPLPSPPSLTRKMIDVWIEGNL